MEGMKMETGLSGAMGALETQKVAAEMMQQSLDQPSQNKLAAPEDAGGERASGRAVTGVGGQLDVTV